MEMQIFPLSETALIRLPTEVLLAKFGSGGHKPGSGSAAALVGILAGKLVITVSSLTEQRGGYSSVRQRIEYIRYQITEKIEPALRHLFQEDAEVFDRVIIARRQRNAARNSPNYRRLENEAREFLKPATELPISIAKHCLKIAELGLVVFDEGFRSARGDSGTAISVALSGAISALFIAYLNLREFRSGEWAQRMRTECDELLTECQRLQVALFSRVVNLRSSHSSDNQQLQLPLLGGRDLPSV